MGRKKPKHGIAWPRWTGFRRKTVWDWLPIVSALLVPLVVALGTGWITWQLAKIEDQRAQDEALQAYLDQTSQLLLGKGLRNAQPDDAVSVATRARTLTILGRVDGARKRSVLLFLYESGLIYKGDKLVVDLSGADLSGAELHGAHLPNVDLSSPTFSYSEQLGNNEQTDATLPDVDLSEADLSGAVLTGADLSGSDLSGSDLSSANLSYARGITNEELEKQAKSLERATMPNGQKYEDWLKSKGSGEND